MLTLSDLELCQPRSVQMNEVITSVVLLMCYSKPKPAVYLIVLYCDIICCNRWNKSDCVQVITRVCVCVCVVCVCGVCVCVVCVCVCGVCVCVCVYTCLEGCDQLLLIKQLHTSWFTL